MIFKNYFTGSFLLIGIALGSVSSSANAFSVDFGMANVAETVTQIGNSWNYQFTASNISPYYFTEKINQFALPYFADAGITSIISPNEWTYAISTTISTPFVTVPVSQFGLFETTTSVLNWSTNSNYIANGGSLTGFGFTSSYAPVKGPYIAGFSDGFLYQGDPGIPGSPLANAAGFTTQYPVSSVPEPETFAMLLAGLGLIGAAVKRRKVKNN